MGTISLLARILGAEERKERKRRHPRGNTKEHKEILLDLLIVAKYNSIGLFKRLKP